jgi:hypothetical protein
MNAIRSRALADGLVPDSATPSVAFTKEDANTSFVGRPGVQPGPAAARFRANRSTRSATPAGLQVGGVEALAHPLGTRS